MKLMTHVEIGKDFPSLSQKDRILSLGSCFSESIGEKLQLNGFNVDINPYGVLYNPMSVINAMKEIEEGKIYTEKDLFEYDGLWHSFMHHGSFSDTDKNEVLKHINERLTKAHQRLAETDYFFITLGSSYVYLTEEGRIVSNCHKLPDTTFKRKRLKTNEIVEIYDKYLYRLFKGRPDLKILFTISPIRHLRDGLHENQISKGALLIATDKLKALYPDNIYYFPAYEIMMDELRDYRFYADDLLHPSSTAIDYIWEKFKKSFFSRDTSSIAEECESIYKALRHRPLHTRDDVNKEFLGQIVLKINRLKEKYPYLELKIE